MKNNIDKILKQRKMTVVELAKRLGTSEVQVHRLKTGQRKLTIEWLNRISKVLNCSISELVDIPSLGVKESNSSYSIQPSLSLNSSITSEVYEVTAAALEIELGKQPQPSLIIQVGKAVVEFMESKNEERVTASLVHHVYQTRFK